LENVHAQPWKKHVSHTNSYFKSGLALDQSVERQDVHVLAILNVMTLLDAAQVAKLDIKIIVCS
jgi:hypothetical protein